MFRFVVIALTVSQAFAGGYGGGFGGAPLGFAGGLSGGLGLGYAAPLGLAGGYARSLPVGPIPAAIQSTRTYEVVPVPSLFEAAVPQTIEVGPNIQPVNIVFRTQSSPLNLRQVHTPAAPQYESTRSEDAPSVLTHENHKTVVQNYVETIQPIRKIETRIQPVIENAHTVVARGEEYRQAPVALAAPAYDALPLRAALPAPLPLPLLGKSSHY
jgi:hypothetical protein